MGSWLVRSPGMLNDLEFPLTPSLMLWSPRQEMGCPPSQSSLDPFKPTGGGGQGSVEKPWAPPSRWLQKEHAHLFRGWGAVREGREAAVIGDSDGLSGELWPPPPPTWVPKRESPPEGTRWQPGFLSLLLVCLHSRSTVESH